MSPLAGGAGFARLIDVGVCGPSETLVELRAGRFRRPWKMRLRLTHWWPGGPRRTLLELTPEQRVPLSSRYFDAGNRFLDEVAERLSRQPQEPRASEPPRPPRASGASRTAA
jgi:hypothetical protein